MLNEKVIKGAWRMPWLLKAMKDVISCDKLRGAASGFDPEISEWGNPIRVISDSSLLNP